MPPFDRTGLLVLDDVFGVDDLEALTGTIEALEFESQDYGRAVISRRERATSESPIIPDLLWRRIGPLLPPMGSFFDGGPGTPRLDPPVHEWEAVGCNPRSRAYRYGPGAAFSEHEDEPWRPEPGVRSLLTVLVYLPVGGCEGGETVVDGTVVPVVDGRVVVFDHGLLHEGRPVERGRKLVLRSDVVARPIASAG